MVSKILRFAEQFAVYYHANFFDYNTDFAIFVSSISQTCQFLIFFSTITQTLPFSLICGIGFSRICLFPIVDIQNPSAQLPLISIDFIESGDFPDNYFSNISMIILNRLWITTKTARNKYLQIHQTYFSFLSCWVAKWSMSSCTAYVSIFRLTLATSNVAHGHYSTIN